MKGRGCDKCNHTGYKGRVGLYEVMEVDDEVKELILVGASGLELRKKAIERGHDHAPAERPAQGEGRGDDDRGSAQRDGELTRWPPYPNCSRRPWRWTARTSTSPRTHRRRSASTASCSGCRCPTSRRPTPSSSSTACSPTRRRSASRRRWSSTSRSASAASPASAATCSTSGARSPASTASFPNGSRASRTWACRPSSSSWPSGRAASCSSPGRPAAASRRRWRR